MGGGQQCFRAEQDRFHGQVTVTSSSPVFSWPLADLCSWVMFSLWTSQVSSMELAKGRQAFGLPLLVWELFRRFSEVGSILLMFQRSLCAYQSIAGVASENGVSYMPAPRPGCPWMVAPVQWRGPPRAVITRIHSTGLGLLCPMVGTSMGSPGGMRISALVFLLTSQLCTTSLVSGGVLAFSEVPLSCPDQVMGLGSEDGAGHLESTYCQCTQKHLAP